MDGLPDFSRTIETKAWVADLRVRIIALSSIDAKESLFVTSFQSLMLTIFANIIETLLVDSGRAVTKELIIAIKINESGDALASVLCCR